MEDLTGKQLGGYQLIAPLGEGGMAVVYKAYQPSMERYLALKILPRHFTAESDFVRRFKQEAKIIASLEHPNILPVHDYGEAEGYTYLVMRYVEGKTLADLLHEKPLPLSQICDIVTKIASALTYAHSRGVVHRDVKPSNVLIDQHGNLLLSDFGIAKMFLSSEKLTASGAFIGTPTYASPEQCLGSNNLDGRSDVYSLGVMLYEMATGRPPFNAETPMAVVLKQINDPLPLPRQLNPTLPESVERVILKALAKQPKNRYQTANELAEALVKAITEAGKGLAAGVPYVPATTKIITAQIHKIPAWGWILSFFVIIGGLVILTGVVIWGLKLPMNTPKTPTYNMARRATTIQNFLLTTTPIMTIKPTSSPTEAILSQATPLSTSTPPSPSASAIPILTGTPTQITGDNTPMPSSATQISENAPHPAIAIGPDRQVYLAWADTSAGRWNVYYFLSSDGGVSFSAPIPVNLEAASPSYQNPALAVGQDGRIHIAWEESQNGYWDIYYAYSVDGKSFSSAVRVNDDVPQTDQVRPALAVGDDSKVYLAWQDNRLGNWDIYSARSTNNGGTFEQNMLVNAETLGQQVDPAIGIDSQGWVHIVWADDQSGTWRVEYAHSEGESFTRGRVVSSGLVEDLSDELPSLAVGQDDKVHVAWSNAYVIHPTYQVPLYLPAYSSSSDQGDTFLDARQVGEGYHYVSVRPPETFVAVDSTAIHVVFTTYSPRDGSWVWYYNSDNDGQSFSEGVGVYQVQGGDVLHYPVVAVDRDGHLHIAWAHQRGEEWDLYYSKSTDGGATFTSGKKISGGN